MNLSIGYAKLLALLSAAFLCITLGIGALRVEHLIPKLSAAADGVNTLTASLNDTDKRLDLSIKEADYTLLKIGLTADSAKKASDKELAMLDVWDTEISRTIRDADTAVLSTSSGVNSISAQAVETMQNVDKSVNAFVPPLQQITTTVASANALIGNPDLGKSLSNTQHATASLSAIADDARQAVHSYLHPTWPHRVWNFVTGIGIDAGKILF